jgi:D-arabinose 1-dehydrogenase-like Zn-dependent alcohol dehydrogenase
MFGIMAMSIEGTLTGTLTEAQELLDLARTKNIGPIPTRNRPLGEAQAALDDLRAGHVVGRTVLTA